MEIQEKDLDVVDDILTELPNVHFITFAELVDYADGDTEWANRLKYLLISEGSAQKPKVGDSEGISSTPKTEQHLHIAHYREKYKELVLKKELREKEDEKLSLDIVTLKKQNKLIYPAFITNIISQLFSIWGIFFKR
jgi:hypothetical protein